MAVQENSLPSAADSRRPLDIVIIGGSLAGLMVGFLLKRNGHNVTILEQSTSSVREGLAAGIGLAFHVRTFFENEVGIDGASLGLLHNGFELVDDKQDVVAFVPKPARLTSWDCAYYHLRATFDGLRSDYVPYPQMLETRGTGTYETGKKTLRVKPDVDGMTTMVEDLNTRETHSYHSDLVIAADGANSSIRRQLHPDLVRQEPGYILWRGTVRIGDLAPDIRSSFKNRAIIWRGKYTYVIVYTIPGDRGCLDAEECHANFAWYFWPSTPSISDIMTDVDGHCHRSTVPKGKLSPQIWRGQIEVAKSQFPAPLYQLAATIKEPFVTVISSISAPTAAYFDNRLFLIGDALTQLQPNSGFGTNLAAYTAKTLAEAIGGDDDLLSVSPANAADGTSLPKVDADKIKKWERNVLANAAILRADSVLFGSWFLQTRISSLYYYARKWFYRWWWRAEERRME